MNRNGLLRVVLTLGAGFSIAALYLSLRGNGSESFSPPDANARQAAIGELKYSPDIQIRAFAESAQFAPKTEPKEMDWLANHPEKGQSFDQFLQTRRNLFQPPRQVLYIQPLGVFTEKQRAVLDDVADYAKIFFQADVSIQKAIDPAKDPSVEITSRQHPGPDDLQFLSTDVLKLLQKDMPQDAYARIAVTMTDLYPDPSWNFVFGQASPVHRVGVYSFARYGEPGDDQFLRRCLRVFAHETGHMFAIMHCIHYQCLMNGSNHMAESDVTPLQLCPICLRKLHAANDFDIRERYQGLQRFFERERFAEDTDWMKRRLTTLP